MSAVIESPRHDRTDANFLDDASGNVEVLVEHERYAAVSRQPRSQRVEERGECWRRGLNHAVSNCDGGSGSGDFTYEKFGSAYGDRTRFGHFAILRDFHIILRGLAS